MNPESVRRLLDDVASGRLAPADAFDRLAWLPVEEVSPALGPGSDTTESPTERTSGASQPHGRGAVARAEAGESATPYARLDHHRILRQGFPEVVFGEGKTTEQIVGICQGLARRGHGFLATRVDDRAVAALLERFPGVRVNAVGRVVHLPGESGTEPVRGLVLLVSAGTADLPVAEEAAATVEALGSPLERLYDVGVAGLHRITANANVLRRATVVIVVAGMEGALPSVVGGLVAAPVIAVPTSIGYGASFQGLAALLGMLNSCAAGVTVVNIDNGFGAACAATRINQLVDVERR